MFCAVHKVISGERGGGEPPGRSELPAFPDPQPSPAPADSGTLGLAPGAVGGADLAWPRAARWHSKATPGHGEGCRGESLCAEFHSPRRLPALLGEKTVTPALLRCCAGSRESQRSSCEMPLIFFPPLSLVNAGEEEAARIHFIL